MSLAERQKFVAGQLADRQRLQERVNGLNTERSKFVAAKQAESAAKSSEKTFDQAQVEAIRSQASEKRFVFK